MPATPSSCLLLSTAQICRLWSMRIVAPDATTKEHQTGKRVGESTILLLSAIHASQRWATSCHKEQHNAESSPLWDSKWDRGSSVDGSLQAREESHPHPTATLTCIERNTKRSGCCDSSPTRTRMREPFSTQLLLLTVPLNHEATSLDFAMET